MKSKSGEYIHGLPHASDRNLELRIFVLGQTTVDDVAVIDRGILLERSALEKQT